MKNSSFRFILISILVLATGDIHLVADVLIAINLTGIVKEIETIKIFTNRYLFIKSLFS